MKLDVHRAEDVTRITTLVSTPCGLQLRGEFGQEFLTEVKWEILILKQKYNPQMLVLDDSKENEYEA